MYKVVDVAERGKQRCWKKKTGVGGWFLFNFGLSFLYARP